MYCVLAGTNNSSVYVYDVGEQKVVARAAGHSDDVNAVRPSCADLQRPLIL